MKTKHILTALAVPMLFAACTDDQFEYESEQSLLKNRPMVGQVTFHDGESGSRLVNPTTGAMEFKDGDSFGMLGMDEVSSTTGNANIGTRFYNLANKAFTNYQFVKDGSVWRSESELMEGNYFYYLPYTNNQKDASKTNVTRNGGLKWVIAEKQNAFTVDAPSVLAPFNATKDNQLYIGYQALNSDDINTNLEAKLAVVHPTVLFEIENAGDENVVIERIVLESTQADNGFGVKGILDVAGGEGTATYKDASDNKDRTYTDENLAKIFGAYNSAVAADRDDFLKNPFANGNFIKTTEDASSISLTMPSVLLASGNTAQAEMVVPADVPETMNVRIYTNKGIVLVPVESGYYTTTVSEGLVEYGSGTLASHSAKIELTKRNTDPEVPGYFNVAADNFKDEMIPNNWNTVSISFDGDAIQIPEIMDIYSTEDLDAFMGYCKLNDNLTLKSYNLTANIKGEDVKLTKEAYSVLKTYPKINLKVDGTLTIPANVEETALDRILWQASSKAIIAEGGKQTITETNANNIANLTIVNKGTLNVAAYNADNTPYKSIKLKGLANYGVLNIDTPLSVTAIYNGTEAETEGGLAAAIYNAVNETAIIYAAADVAGAVYNLGEVEVNGNILIDVINNNKVTLSGSSPVKSKAGLLTVNKDKHLTTSGKNDGKVIVNGIFTAYEAFANNASIENNYGLENIAGKKLNNTSTGYITVAADAKFTAVNDNAGTIEIMKRSTQVNSDNNIGKILYTAEEGNTFTVMSSDKFNTVKFNESKTLEIEHSSKYPNAVVAAALERTKDLTVLIAAEGNYAFAEYYTEDYSYTTMQIAGLEVEKSVYATIISNVDITESISIESNSTIQLDKYYTVNYTGDAGFVNEGTFRNLGTLTASCNKPDGVWTGSGKYVWGTGVETENELKEAIGEGGVITLKKSITLTSQLNISNDVTIIGGTISGKPVSITNNSNVVFENVTFDNAKDGSESSVYATGDYNGNLTFKDCVFSGFKWDAIQITPAALSTGTITIDGCEFSAEMAQRYVHIEGPKVNGTTAEIILTNNTFGSKNNVTNSLIDIDYVVKYNQITAGKNKFNDTREDLKGQKYIYICGNDDDDNGVYHEYATLGEYLPYDKLAAETIGKIQ